MAQDYAKKKHTRKGAVRQSPVSKSTKKKSKNGRKLLSIVVLFSLIGTMAYGLYQLALVSPDPDNTQAAVHNNVEKTEQTSAAPSQQTTPQKPVVDDSNDNKENTKDFTFYDLLPKSEVVPPDVPEYKSTPKSAKSYSIYVLQAGSFRNQSDAEGLRAQLILEGLPNVVANKVESANGSIWYRVRTGPFDSRSQLNKAQDKLVRMNLQPMQVKLSEQ